jgi:hypothetical protein
MTVSERDREEEAVLKTVWTWYQRNCDSSFAEVVQQARALSPSIDPERVWRFFEVRLRGERGTRASRRA